MKYVVVYIIVFKSGKFARNLSVFKTSSEMYCIFFLVSLSVVTVNNMIITFFEYYDLRVRDLPIKKSKHSYAIFQLYMVGIDKTMQISFDPFCMSSVDSLNPKLCDYISYFPCSDLQLKYHEISFCFGCFYIGGRGDPKKAEIDMTFSRPRMSSNPKYQ